MHATKFFEEKKPANRKLEHGDIQLHCRPIIQSRRTEKYESNGVPQKLLSTSYPNRRTHQSRAQGYPSSDQALNQVGVLPCHWSAGHCVCQRSEDNWGYHRTVRLTHVHRSGC